MAGWHAKNGGYGVRRIMAAEEEAAKAREARIEAENKARSAHVTVGWYCVRGLVWSVRVSRGLALSERDSRAEGERAELLQRQLDSAEEKFRYCVYLLLYAPTSAVCICYCMLLQVLCVSATACFHSISCSSSAVSPTVCCYYMRRPRISSGQLTLSPPTVCAGTGRTYTLSAVLRARIVSA
eukprot:674959-Rhodomonas_salina.1